MSKYANPGELRTPVYFFSTAVNLDDDGYQVGGKENIFGENVPVYCKWVNVHGTETFAAMQLRLSEPATLTCRYSPKINSQLIVYRCDDPMPYEIISIDNVDNRNVWIEIKVQRMEAAR
jgi:hypothetical protein